MDEILSNKYFKKEAYNHFSKKHSYLSKIINSLLLQNYSKKELSTNFASKPTYYLLVKRLKTEKILELKDDRLSLNNDFKKALDYYSLQYIILRETENNFKNLKNQVLKQEMKDACAKLEKILGFKEE